MTIPVDLLKNGLAEFGVNADETALERFQVYAEQLVFWNERINLTAITDPREIVIKHFIDSAALLSCVKIPPNARLIDVGTGAGFPSVVVKILRPDLSVTLLDSLRKRTDFLSALLETLSLEAEVVHMRAEDGGQSPRFRERFDFATARAVANLRELSELCLPFVKTGGFFAALKGPDFDAELQSAKRAIALLGGTIADNHPILLPDSSHRTIISVKKISQTPTKYPRAYAKIVKAPL